MNAVPNTHAPPRRKPQLLRERHTTEAELLMDALVQNTEIKALAHQIQGANQTAEQMRLKALAALQKGNVEEAIALLERQASSHQVVDQLATELLETEAKDEVINRQQADILRIRERDWGSET